MFSLYNKSLCQAMLFCILVCSLQCTRPKEYKELAHEFDSLYQSQQYEQAYQVGHTILSREEYRREAVGQSGIGFYSLMGLIAMKYQCYEEAERYFQRNIESLKQQQMTESFLYADNLSNLGVVFFCKKQYTLAIEALQKGIPIRERKYPKHLSQLALDYLNLGSIHLDYGSGDSAYTALKRASELYDSLKIRDQLLLALNFYGQACMETKRYNQAIEIAKKGLTLVQDNEVEMPLVFYSLLGTAYSFTKQYSLADKQFLAASTLFNNLNPKPNTYYWFFLTMAEQYSRRGNPERAIELYKEALRQAVEQYSEISSEAIDVFTSYGNHFMRYHNYERAVELYSKAQDACKTSIGTDNSAYFIVLNRLDSAYTLLGQKGKADSIEQELQSLKKQLPL